MTKSPEQEANELVEMFRDIEFGIIEEYIPEPTPVFISLAALHVERLIEVLAWEMQELNIEARGCKINSSLQKRYMEILAILKSKL